MNRSSEQDPTRQDSRNSRQDHRSNEQDHRSMEQDPRTMEQDPRSMEQDPRSMEQDHRSMEQDPRTIMTLDAGGTNLVFSAIRGNREVVSPITLPAHADNLEKSLETIMRGFGEIEQLLEEKPAAISFAFPGPADYPLGIIGNLPNFPAYTGGVPLGPMLEDQFRIPVFINNDGNLFAYGEALAGYLPWLNRRIREAGGVKQYHILVGFTLGTGFGAGIVHDDHMLVGNSSCGAEIHNTLNALHPSWNAEESVSTRAIKRIYREVSGLPAEGLTPGDIFEIATGKREGDRHAAGTSFAEFGKALGHSIANTMSLIDGIVVLGGGLTGAWDLFAPEMFETLNGNYLMPDGTPFPRLSYRVFNLEDGSIFDDFVKGKLREITVPVSQRKILYDDMPRTGVGLSRIGASRSIALGAYAFALNQLDQS